MYTQAGPRFIAALPEETRPVKRQKQESNSTSIEPSQTSLPSVTQPTTTILLTTTFTPAPSCAENRLTMLPPPGYFIWANEPIPAANQTSTGCYPNEFLTHYQPVPLASAGSSVVPAMGDMVCPKGYCTMLVAEANNYAACCPSGYRLHSPEAKIDARRPGYGGTCYSDFSVSSTYLVTAYDTSGQSNIQEFVATTSGAQAYAHPIDGFARSPASLGCPKEAPSDLVASVLPIPTASPTASPTTKPSTSEKPSPAIIAGISIGAVSALISIIALVWFLLRRAQRQRRPPAPPPKIYHLDHELAMVEIVGSDVAEKMSAVDPIFEKDCTVITEMDGSSTAKMGDKTHRESHLRGPFEMSADAMSISGDIEDIRDDKDEDERDAKKKYFT